MGAVSRPSRISSWGMKAESSIRTCPELAEGSSLACHWLSRFIRPPRSGLVIGSSMLAWTVLAMCSYEVGKVEGCRGARDCASLHCAPTTFNLSNLQLLFALLRFWQAQAMAQAHRGARRASGTCSWRLLC